MEKKHVAAIVILCLVMGTIGFGIITNNPRGIVLIRGEITELGGVGFSHPPAYKFILRTAWGDVYCLFYNATFDLWLGDRVYAIGYFTEFEFKIIAIYEIWDR